MAKIQLWMEGFAVTGQSQGAQLIWQGEAEDMDDAILKYEKRETEELGKPYKVDRYEGDQATRSKYGIWACRIFDNEADARKSFG